MKQNKGFIPIIIAIVAVVAVGAVGFFILRKSKFVGVIPAIKIPGTSGIGLNTNCKLNDPELCRYMDKSIKMADSYKTGFIGSSTTTDKTGKKSESRWEMRDDRTHFVTLENGKEQSNIIVIGNTTYTKDLSDNKWTKFTLKSEQGDKNLFSFDVEEMKNRFKDTIKDTEDKMTYKSLGKESCGSLTCFKYEIINPLVTDIKEYVYFDDQEYIMRKMRIEDKSGLVTETMFEFKTVTIDEPSPIKESPASNLFEDQGSSTSSIDAEKLQQFIEQMKSEGSQPSEETSETNE